MTKTVTASLLMIALVAPFATAGVGTAPTRWNFIVDDNGVWHANGQHVSFSWTLKPFEVYDIMVDGVLVIEEISFPVDATDYMTKGASFKVMMGDELLFSFEDNANLLIDMNCNGFVDETGIGVACDIEAPRGSEFMVNDLGSPTLQKVTVEVPPMKEGGIDPCWRLAVHGSLEFEGSTIMFMGDGSVRLLRANEDHKVPTDRWMFQFDAEGQWHAMGQHVSFAWNLKPFEVYDLSVDGVMLISELSFPGDADGFMTHGGVFVVMAGGMDIFSVQDNSVAAVKATCGIIGPEKCDLEFPEGAEVMSMAGGKGQMSLFHVEYEGVGGTVVPCGTLGVRGEVSIESLEASIVMFAGSIHLHYPVGQVMVA